jgi:hypothetical protein
MFEPHHDWEVSVKRHSSALGIRVGWFAALVVIFSTTAASGNVAFFCGHATDATIGMQPYGIAPNKKFAARLHLTDREPDLDNGFSTQWDCTTEGCGEVDLRFEGFRPPGTFPFGASILGDADAAGIQRTTSTYNMSADFDGFLPGAMGQLDVTIICPGCWSAAHIQSPGPQVTLGTPEVNGEVVLALQVPGISGGAPQEARLAIAGFGIVSCLKYFILLRGDFDDDNDVDLSDGAQYGGCYTGDGGGPASGTCLRADHDEDLDVDCTDRLVFLDRWTDVATPQPLAQCGESGPAMDIPTLPTYGVLGLGLLLTSVASVALAVKRSRR